MSEDISDTEEDLDSKQPIKQKMSENYFPEIIDERSSYLGLSPLTAIIHELRRKNVVTAAAASGPQMSLLDSSDPWGSTEATGAEDAQVSAFSGSTCSCTKENKFSPRRRMSWSDGGISRYGARRPSTGYFSGSPSKSDYSTDNIGINGSRRQHESSSVQKGTTCPNCGKRRRDENGSIDAISRSPRGNGISKLQDRTRTERLDEPQHAEALLQSTPHLRIICPASTDMQGAGTTTPRNFLSFVLAPMTDHQNKNQADHQSSSDSNGSTRNSSASDYRASLIRDRANQQAAAELSSLLWILAHEMSLEDYGTVESEVFKAVFALVHSSENERRMAGLAAVDGLIDAPSADEEKKAIKFANTLSNGLRSAHGDYEFLSAVSKALGHMATRTANVDFVESEVTRALEWLRTDRSDRR